MDGIQIYYVILLTMGLTASMFMHGQDKGEHNFFMHLIKYIVMLPIIGRVFGWW